jgi:hypothetical protein
MDVIPKIAVDKAEAQQETGITGMGITTAIRILKSGSSKPGTNKKQPRIVKPGAVQLISFVRACIN